jgi:O-antigen/teichoic acid export membrane protein
MITGYRTLAEVGIYNAIVPTVMMLLFFGKSISAVIQPMIAEMKAKSEEFTIAQSLLILEKYAAMIIVPASVGIAVLSGFLLNLLFGASFVPGAETMAVLSISMIPLVIYTIHASYFSALGKPGIATKILLIAAAVNVVINVLLIPSQGMVGAALASLVAYTLAAVLSTIKLRKLVNAGIDVTIKAWIKITFAGIIMFLVMMFGVLIAGPIIPIIAGAAIYLLIVFITRAVHLSELKYLLEVAK